MAGLGHTRGLSCGLVSRWCMPTLEQEPGSRAAQPERRGVARSERGGCPGAPAGMADGGVGLLSPEESPELLGRWAAPSGHGRPGLHL